MKIMKYNTVFVKTIPRELESGTLYISTEYNIAMHLCACGCRCEIATPIALKNGWIVTYDGETASLHPSIGNGAYKCHSHYFLRGGRVIWLDPIYNTRPTSIELAAASMAKKKKWWKLFKQ